MTIGKNSLHSQRIRQEAARRRQVEARRQAEAQQRAQTEQANAKRAQEAVKRMVDLRETGTKRLQTNPTAPKPATLKPATPATLQPGQALRPSTRETGASAAQNDLQSDFRNRLQFSQLSAPNTSAPSPSAPGPSASNANAPGTSAPVISALGGNAPGPSPLIDSIFGNGGPVNTDTPAPVWEPQFPWPPQPQTQPVQGPSPRSIDGSQPEESQRAIHDLSPAEQRQVEEANAAFTNEVDDIATADGKDGRRDETLEASAALETQLVNLDPALHEAFLEEAGPALDTLTANAGELTGDQTKTFLGNLSRTAEAAGPEHASAVTDKLAKNMPDILAEHHKNGGEFHNAIKDSIANGDGTVFAASLIESLQKSGQPTTANGVATATADGIQSVRETYDDKLEEVNKLNSQLGQYVAEWSGVLTEEELNGAIDAFKQKHAAVYDEWKDAGADLATTFEGAGELVAREGALGTLDESGELLKQVEKALEQLPSASQIPSVQDLIAQGMEEGSSFITEAASFLYDRAGDVNKARGQADKFAKAIFEVTASRAEALVKSQDLEGLEELLTDFQGAARGLGVAGVNDPEKLEELTDLVRTARQQTPPDFEAFSEQFAEKTGELNGKVFADGSVAQNAFKSLGLVVSAGALVSDIRNFSDAEVENKLQTIVDAVDLGVDAYKLFKNPAAFKSLGRVTGGLGAVLGAVDAVRFAANKDYANAGLSAASVVGSILMTTSVGGPVGTAVGAVISVGVVAGSFALNHHRSNQAEDRSEENLETFLQGAGFTADQAYRLRDVTHLSHQSIGNIFTQLGEQNGVGGRALLDDFLEKVPHDQQDNFVDAIEALKRDDQGLFTDASLLQAAEIFRIYGVTP